MLIYENEQIKTNIRYLKPRNKTSLNFVRSAWKCIVGKQDHDLEILKRKIDIVLENNNRREVVNSMCLETMDEITIKRNEILKTV